MYMYMYICIYIYIYIYIVYIYIIYILAWAHYCSIANKLIVSFSYFLQQVIVYNEWPFFLLSLIYT